MHTFVDAKIMARALRQALAERDVTLSHSDCLELVASQFGLPDWNTLSARIEAAGAPGAPLPEGWAPSGGAGAGAYRIGLDPAQNGAARVEAIAPQPRDFEGMMQSIVAAPYRGQRLRLSARLKGQGVEAGTIWMRIDPAQGRPPLGFDNMMSRTGDGVLHGTFDWTGRDIVLDVPAAAASIHYGFFLRGVGTLWARDFGLTVVGDETGVTGGPGYLPRPTNLGFEGPAPAA